jgi:hypothetical protein
MSAENEGLLSRVPMWLGALGIALVGLALAGLKFGPSGVVLALAALTLVAVITAFWSSLRTLLGETRLTGADAYAIGAPRVEEEQKRAVLRALKDLEFERSVGKISDDDYKVLVNEYRREAKRLLRMLDEASADQRARAEKEVNRRLAELGLAPPTAAELEAMAAEPDTKTEAEPDTKTEAEPDTKTEAPEASSETGADARKKSEDADA